MLVKIHNSQAAVILMDLRILLLSAVLTIN